MTRRQSTWIGSGAILLWSLLAILTVATTPVPPMQLNTMCFGLAGTLGLIWLWRTGGLTELRAVPVKIYAFGTLGVFGYHALYFSALRLAPPAEASLIAYLWPLLIVLMSSLLPGETLRKGHVIGGILGFAGAAILLGPGLSGAWTGYALALGCAVTWSGYSVLSRRFADVPTSAVIVYCLATACLSLVAHCLWEDTQTPATTLGWAATLALALGPVGSAFFLWDIGVKKGDIQLLGVLSYAAPVLSTTALVCFGVAPASLSLLAATVLITTGAVIAARART